MSLPSPAMPRAEQRKESPHPAGPQTCSTNTLKPQSPHPAGPGAEFTNLFYKHTEASGPEHQSIRIKQIRTQSKQNYIAYWETQAQSSSIWL